MKVSAINEDTALQTHTLVTGLKVQTVTMQHFPLKSLLYPQQIEY